MNAALVAPVSPDDNLSRHWPHACVLVVDNEPAMRHVLEKTLAPCAGRVLLAASAEAAEALIALHPVDLLILDISLPGQSGLALLHSLRQQGVGCQVVLITAFANLDTAVDALRAGANDLLLKPFRVTQVLGALQRCLQRAALRQDRRMTPRPLPLQLPPDGLVGPSIVMQGLRAALQRVARVDSTVLLTGESGTGKELAARALHARGTRAGGPFVPVNCATLSPARADSELFCQTDGLFVHAEGGTLFLDEVSELPAGLQATLLRALEERRIRPIGSAREMAVDVRIVAATKRPLIDDVMAGRFRRDLYHRLHVVEITLAPLRAHKEDLPDLVAHFIATLSPRLGVAPIDITPGDMDDLQRYDWPGNVRELRNLVEHSLITGGLNVSSLYQSMDRLDRAQGRGERALTCPNPVDLQTLEKQHILAVLGSVAGDKTVAAQLLGISRRTLERRCAGWAGP